MHKNDSYQQKCRVERDWDGVGAWGAGDFNCAFLQLCKAYITKTEIIQSTYIKCEHCQD